MEYRESIESRSGKYRCKGCHYTSNRHYNVLRHEERIHSRKLKRSCCGKIFHTKGEWYFHCEEFHPNLRATSFISKKKYKIIKHSRISAKSFTENVDKIEKRRSARIRESIEKEQSMMIKFDAATVDELETENVPLIHFIQHRELRRKLIEKSCEMFNNNRCTTISAENGSSHDSDKSFENSASLTITEDGKYTNKQVGYDREIVAIKTQTLKYVSCSDESNISSNDSMENIPANSRAMTDVTLSSSIKSTCTSETVETSLNLPLKKRILQELRIHSMEKNRQRRLRPKSINENFKWNDKENINPISETIHVSKKVTVMRAEESVTWNEITKKQRAYLSSVDWERYKIFQS